ELFIPPRRLLLNVQLPSGLVFSYIGCTIRTRSKPDETHPPLLPGPLRADSQHRSPCAMGDGGQSRVRASAADAAAEVGQRRRLRRCDRNPRSQGRKSLPDRTEYVEGALP